MKLVLETDGQAMQGANWFPIPGIVGIQGLSVFNGRIEENLMETIGLDDQFQFRYGKMIGNQILFHTN